MTVQIMPRVSAVSQSLQSVPYEVERLTRGSPVLYGHRRWLALEEVAHPERHFYTWVNGRNGTGFAAAYRFTAASNPWILSRLDLYLGHTTGRKFGAELLPNYLLGGRRPGHSVFLTDAPAHHRAGVLDRLIGDAAQQAADRGAATIAALYCDPEDAELTSAFERHGAVRMPAPANHTLALPAGGWDGWIESLPAKRRHSERADLRKLEQAGVTFRARTLRAPDIDEIVPLELSLYGKYGHEYQELEARALHQTYLGCLGRDAVIVRAEREGRLIGFASIVRHDGSAYLRQGGFDAEACEGLPVYFGAAFHTAIRWAGEAGVTKLDLSVSSDEAKRLRGAVSRPRQAFVIALSDAARAALNVAL